MRTSTWLWTGVVGLALPVGVMAGCGDDGTGGSGGQGGDTTTTTSSGTTKSSSSSSSQGGGGSTPGNDTCADPTVITAAEGDTETVQGTTDGAADDYTEPCGDDVDDMIEGPDVVYEVQLADECTATITASTADANFNMAMSVRLATCMAHESTDYCLNNAAAGGTETLLAALPAGTYYIVVDGADGSSGDFSLEVACAAPACGDSVANTGEECDDGNTMPGDGCDATCQFEPSAPDLDLCPDVEMTGGISVPMGSPLYVPASPEFETTLGATDSGTGSCMGIADPPTPAPDHIYKVIPESNGTLTATVGLDHNDQDICAIIADCDPAAGCVDRAIWARSSDCDMGTEVGCSDNALDPAAVESISFPVTAGSVYYVFVDGYDGAVDACSSGAYTLKLELN